MFSIMVFKNENEIFGRYFEETIPLCPRMKIEMKLVWYNQQKLSLSWAVEL